ncbi:MAG: hypothetical protein N2B06_12640 [Clostridium sp.]
MWRYDSPCIGFGPGHEAGLGGNFLYNSQKIKKPLNSFLFNGLILVQIKEL